MTTETLTSDELAFAFLHSSYRPPKPRTRGVTEIRGPYYTAMAPAISRTCWRRWETTSTRSSSPAGRSR
jgi:hypothetical protein